MSFSNTVTTEAQLDTDIKLLDGTATPGTYTITFGSNITETFDPSAINLHSGVTLVINGAGFALDGGSAHRGLMDFNGAVTINNLTIRNMLAQGGAGGTSGSFAGGGGAGLGGGLFIAGTNVVNGTTFTGGTVTLNSVSFSGDTAKGGAGGNSAGYTGPVTAGYAGGGGMGGAGGNAVQAETGGGGGIGQTAYGAVIPGAVGKTIANTPPIAGAGTLAGSGILFGGAAAGNGVGYGSGGVSSNGGASGGGGGMGEGHFGSGGVGGSGAGGGGLGGSNGSLASQGTGGQGGFGGGGGGGYGRGGYGGFGGGGGAGYAASGKGGFGGGGSGGGGIGGFGAGNGGGATSAGLTGGAGGGGLGAGADIFVQQGGVLIIGAGSLGVGTVIAGAAGQAVNSGSYTAPATIAGTFGLAFGSGIFIQNANTAVAQAITFAPASGQTLTVSGAIADQIGSGGTGTNATAASVVVSGAGKVVLGATSTYSGGTKLQSGGTLDLNAGSAAGTGAITFGTGFGELQIQSAAMSGNIFNTNTIGGIVAGDVINLAGLAFTSGATASVVGSTLTVKSGATTQTLTVSGSPSGFSVIQDSVSGSDVIINTFTVTSLSDLTTDLAAINIGGVDSFAGVNYTFDFTNTFALSSTQTIDLGTGSSLGFAGTGHTTGGGYDVVAGALVAGATGAIGTGAVTIGSGATLNLGTFNQTIGDLSGAGTITLGSGTLTEGTASNTLLSGVISGAGGLVKQGTGTLTLTGANTPGTTTINAGVVQLGNGGATGSLSGSIADNATLAVNETGTVTVGNTISGTGKFVQAGSGTTVLSAANSFAGGLVLNGGKVVLGAAGAAGSGKITFGTGTIFAFGSAAAPGNIVSGLVQNTDTIDVTGVTVTSTDMINTNTVQINLSTGSPIDVTLDPGQSYAGLFAHHAASGSDNFITLDTTPCYCSGTLILTDRGEVAVEELVIGDRLVTLSGETKPIKWIGRRSYAGRFVTGNRNVQPILIRAEALDDNVPRRDLYVSPQHAMFLDKVLVPAEMLVNGASIVRCETAEIVKYFHIELDTHDVILAEGAPAESFVDCDNRLMFHNADEFARLYPDDTALPRAFCAPRIEAGDDISCIRARLEERLARFGETITFDPDLRLIADGREMPAYSVQGLVYRFRLTKPPATLRIASRSTIPTEVAVASTDTRRLGVTLSRLVLSNGNVSLVVGHQDSSLVDGFHAAEATHRWTDGDACVPAKFLACFDRELVVEVELLDRNLPYRSAAQSEPALPNRSASAV